MIEQKCQEINLETGVVIKETFRLNGRLHRDETQGPARIRRASTNGKVAVERYYRHGALHREAGPAETHYNVENGVCFLEWYYRHGRLHRDPKEGPAKIDRTLDGSVVTEEIYCVNGRNYRDPADGPCHIERNEDGSVKYQFFSGPKSPEPPDRRSQKTVGKKPSP